MNEIVQKTLDGVYKLSGISFPKSDIEELLSLQLNPLLLKTYFTNPQKNKFVESVLNSALTIGQILALQQYYEMSDEYDSSSDERNNNKNTKSRNKNKNKNTNKNKSKAKSKKKNKSRKNDVDADIEMNVNGNDEQQNEHQQEFKEAFNEEYETVVSRTQSKCVRTITFDA